MQTLENHRIDRIKRSFATRRIPAGALRAIDTDAADLAAGDLVVARIEQIGQHTRIEQPDGRRALLYPGDEVLLVCGARYAPDQFEAACPTAVGSAQMAAAGGIAGHVQYSHARMKPATAITILGAALRADGSRLRLSEHAVRSPAADLTFAPPVPIVAVCGTSMNSGKTHTVASLVRGLALAGRRVAAIKATGTGAGGDLWFFRDSGAMIVRDFTDAGFGTTYRADPEAILHGTRHLVADAVESGAEIVVMEIADGLGQDETAALLRMTALRAMLSGVIFAAQDSMGAAAGTGWLRAEGHRLLAVSGLLTASPLALRETLSLVDLPCLTPDALNQPEIALQLCFGAGATGHDARSVLTAA